MLIVEDEKSLNRVISKSFEKEGFCVDSCFNGEEALNFILTGEYDAVVMDIMMPKMSGMEVLRTLRARKITTPVLLLTAKDSIPDRVSGLNAGADDYLIKPFAFEELLARIRVMLRKSSGGISNIYQVGDLILNTESLKVTRAENEIKLTAKEYSILEYLMVNKGIVMSREKIENHVWNFDYEGGTNVVDVYILYLRKKIDAPYEKKLIHTVKGKGYVIREE